MCREVPDPQLSSMRAPTKSAFELLADQTSAVTHPTDLLYICCMIIWLTCFCVQPAGCVCHSSATCLRPVPPARHLSITRSPPNTQGARQQHLSINSPYNNLPRKINHHPGQQFDLYRPLSHLLASPLQHPVPQQAASSSPSLLSAPRLHDA
jgi:hypothetical protein